MISKFKRICKLIKKALSGKTATDGKNKTPKGSGNNGKGKGKSAKAAAGTGTDKKNSKRARLKKELSIEKAASDARLAFMDELLHSGSSAIADGGEVKDHKYSAFYSGLILTEGFDPNSVLPKIQGESCQVKDAMPAGGEDQYALLKAIRAFAGERLLPDTVYSRGEFRYFRNRFNEQLEVMGADADLTQMYTDWLFFCKDHGYDMDDYFDYEFYRRSLAERNVFVSASFRDNIRRHLNTEPKILARKGQFLDTFRSVIKRPWLDCSVCTKDEFIAFCKANPLFFCKTESGFGAEGMQRLTPSPDELDDLYEKCKEQHSVVEAPIKQHEQISRFNPDTVNSIRVVTIADAEDKIVIASAAMRFGRAGGFADNYHHGGLCAHVDTATGTLRGDAIDRTGKHFAVHPDSGLRFDGFRIPCWDSLCEEVSRAADLCKDSNRFVGWDIAVTESGEIDFIEGNSRPGFGILQAPTMEGLKSKYIKILSGLVTEEDLLDAGKGYWRKWKINL